MDSVEGRLAYVQQALAILTDTHLNPQDKVKLITDLNCYGYLNNTLGVIPKKAEE